MELRRIPSIRRWRSAQLIFLLTIYAITWPNWLRIASASPSPLADPKPHLRDGSLETSTETMQVVNLTRQHEGDIFTANELLPTCNMDTCVGLSSGTAGLFVPSHETEIQPGHEFSTSSTSTSAETEKCQCRCLQHLNTYREDLGICVDDIHECTLSSFVSGSSSEKIPFVFLPLRGQIIHPSREINFPGVRTPVCAVTSAQYLTQKGWSELRNPVDNDVPFRLFRDEGRTFLQWLGETDLRHKMQGRLILVHMMCRDMSAPNVGHDTKGTVGVAQKNLFTPCVAFRVNGSPIHYLSNVPEVLFQSENSNLQAPPEGFHTKEYIVIGICSLILGLVYVASVFLYLHVKKRKSQSAMGENRKNGTDTKKLKNDQITFGVPFSRTESFYGGVTENRNSQRSNHSNIIGGGKGMESDEMGIVKSNPLLRHFPSLNDNSGFVSDRSNSNSEYEDTCNKMSDRTKNMKTSAIVHPGGDGQNKGISMDPSGNPENERIPEDSVNITEENGIEEKLENMKAVVNGSLRKKLYFNPAYFEPHLLMSPPPAAIEFLTKIREVIAIAKTKMAAKRYQPSLNIIPEEHRGSSTDVSAKPNASQNETASPKTEPSNRLMCSGCPGCSSNTETPSKCDNCGDKHKSIQKWLEGVTFTGENSNDLKAASIDELDEKDEKIETTSEEEIQYKKEIEPRKKIPPPLPLTAPKVISHSMKPHLQKSPTGIAEQPVYVRSPSIHGSQASSPKSSSKRDKDTYAYKKATGTEIYNNPNFLESPQLSVRSKTSSSKRSRSSKKKVEVLDQYSNPGEEIQSHYEMLKSIQHMPDMVYEALAKDYSIRNFPTEKSSAPHYNIPTPDYDGTYSKKLKDIYNNSTGSGPFVPTPDYSTMSKRSIRQYQPDSPIYRRRSPQYLIVDYETDSLERGSSIKKDSSSSPPLSNNSSEISSQPSPSLSTALPLEEEVEVHHTVYDKVEGFRKDGDTKKRIATEYELNRQRRESSPKIKYDTPFQGSMTIEVAHDPQSDEVSTDSDQFEPDTLDRKPKKQNSGSFRSLNAWTEYLNKSQSFVNNHDKVSYSSLENMTSLPEFTSKATCNEQLILRSTNSFRSNSGQYWSSGKNRGPEGQQVVKQNFGSLREIYQSKVQQQATRPKLANLDFDEPGRLLTLDAKHSKRQRQDISDRARKLMPPDVIPADNNNFYDIPRRPEKVDGLIMRKNLEGWSTSDSSRKKSRKSAQREDTPPSTEDTDTVSDQSESTEITGVSDTQINSDSHNTHKKGKVSHWSTAPGYADNERILQIDYSAMYNSQQRKQAQSANNANSFISVKIGNDSSYQTYHFNSVSNNVYSLPEENTQSDSMSSSVGRADENSRDSLMSSSSSPSNNMGPCSLNIQRVYRVEVPPPSNGMQIAMGLRDRAKKTKDLKNAWRKFVSMATGKFNGNSGSDKDIPKDSDDPFDHKSVLSSDCTDRDEGISSLIQEGNQATGMRRCQTSGGSLEHMRRSQCHGKHGVTRSHSVALDHRVGGGFHCRQDMDSGYISGDDCKPYMQPVYETYDLREQPESCEDTVNVINVNPEISNDVDARHYTTRRRPQTPKAKKNSNVRQQLPTTYVKSSDNNIQLDLKHPIEVSVYSSDEEACPTPLSSSESDDGGNTEDMCESGAESVETHSVLFKSIRYRQRNDPPE